MVWKKIFALRVKGLEEDNVYVEEIRKLENRDQERRFLKEAKIKGTQCIFSPITSEGVAILLRGIV